MELSTPAIVLNTTKYGETSVIMHAYTQVFGLHSFVVKGVRSSNRKKNFSMGMFQPLTQLEIMASDPKRSSLSVLKSAKITPPYTTISTDIVKSSVCMFLAEVLRSVLREEEQNPTLYSFLANALVWIDTHDHIANTHIFILVQLTKYLGFFPDISTIKHPYFDVQNGQFCPSPNNVECESGSAVSALKIYLGTKFDKLETILVTSEQRRGLLRLLMRYYQLHVQSFREPKSLEILYEVFNS
ncbi:MAG: DNA repair protein RecO [Flavobacteriaceae bacterium]